MRAAFGAVRETVRSIAQMVERVVIALRHPHIRCPGWRNKVKSALTRQPAAAFYRIAGARSKSQLGQQLLRDG